MTTEVTCRAEKAAAQPTKAILSGSWHKRATTMNKNELNKYWSMLAAKQAELTPQLRRRDGIAIEKTPDPLDEVGLAAARELITRNLERESKLLRDVRGALERIGQGSYGTCLHCEEEISTKRLNAVPWASLCIDCQELEDRSRGQGADRSEWLPKAA
jgi:DnaK suppressor protein